MALPTIIVPMESSVNQVDYAQIGGYGIDILTEATINTSGQDTRIFQVYGAQQIEVHITILGGVAGGGTLKFSLNVDEVNTLTGTNPLTATPIATTATYAGAAIATGLGTTDVICVLNNPLADYVHVSWVVAGGVNPSFASVFVRLVVKK